MSFARWVRLTIRIAFPRGFRDAYGAELLESAVARAAARGPSGIRSAGYRAWILYDVLRAGLAVRAEVVGHLRPPSGSAIGSALRSLSKTPAFTIAIVLLLSVSAAGTLVGLAVTRGYLFVTLPLPDAERLVSLDYWTMPGGEGLDPWGAPETLSSMDWAVVETIGDAALMDVSASYAIVGDGQSDWISGRTTTPDFFALLGSPPALGRYLTESDDLSMAVISHRLWTTRFGGAQDVVGSTIRVHSIGTLKEPRSLQVVGVLPADAWFPTGVADLTTRLARSRMPRLIRLSPGIEPEEAAQRIAESVAAQSPTPIDPSWRPAVTPLADEYRAEAAGGVAALLIGIATLLGIAITNVSILAMVRAEGRRIEFSTRRALGAPPGRLRVMLLGEASLLVGTSAAVGLGCAVLVLEPIAGALDVTIGRVPGGASSVGLGKAQLVVYFAASATVALLLATIADRTLRGSRTGGDQLRSRSHTAASRDVLTAFQVGLSVTVLVVGGLLARSTLLLSHVDMGYTPEGVVAAEVALHSTRYLTQEQQADFFDRTLVRTAELPEVESVSILRYSLAFDVPTDITVRASDGAMVGSVAVVQPVGAGFFETLAIPLVSGRGFLSADRTDGPVAVVGRRFADSAWPGQNPIGQQIRLGLEDDQWHTVVGVSGEVREHLIRPDLANVYVARSRHPSPWGTIVARGNRPTHEVMPKIVEAIASIDPNIPPWGLRALTERAEAPARSTRILALVLLGFAIVATSLTSVGIYGTVAYRVERQAKELRIRMALGADGAQVAGRLLLHSARTVGLGVLGGLITASLTVRLIEGQLFQIGRFDPMTYGVIGSMSLIVALAAAAIAARGVAKIPIAAME